MKYIPLSYEELTHYANKFEDLCNEKDKEIEKLYKELEIKTNFIADILKIILVTRDYELHEKCGVRGKLYEEKLQELKGSSNNE